MAEGNQYGFFRDVKLTDGALNVNITNGALFSYTSVNYTELLTKTSMEDSDMAYVYNSQGTAWLPGTVGGNYYPKGVYIYDGVNWTSDRNSIAIQLEADADANTFTDAEKNKIALISVTSEIDLNETLLISDSLSEVNVMNKLLTQDDEVVHPLVESAVPIDAVFTDTVYIDTDVLKDSDTITSVTNTNKIVTNEELQGVSVLIYNDISKIIQAKDFIKTQKIYSKLIQKI